MSQNHQSPTNDQQIETQRGIDVRLAAARAGLKAAQEAYDRNPNVGTLAALLRARDEFERLRGIPLPSLAKKGGR